MYIVKGKNATKAAFQTGYSMRGHTRVWDFPNKRNPRPTHSVKMGILRTGYPFPMLAAKEASSKWVLICCACSLLKTRKGRERNGTETKNQRRAYRDKKSSISRIADTRNYHTIRQDALSFYGKLRRKQKPAP